MPVASSPVPDSRPWLGATPFGLLPAYAQGWPAYFRATREHLARVAAERRPQVLLTHEPRAAWLAMHAKGLQDLPRLYFIHSCWGEEYRLDHPNLTAVVGGGARELVELRALRSADRVAVLSRYMESRVACPQDPRLPDQPGPGRRTP